jgi:transcription antitermination factor NusG
LVEIHKTLAMAEPYSMEPRVVNANRVGLNHMGGNQVGLNHVGLNNVGIDRNCCAWSEYQPTGANGRISWVAVYTKRHHEKSIANHLAEQSIDCFLPLYRSERSWSNHRTAIIDLPLFPTYLFARISRPSRARVLKTPGVIGIVGRGATDDPISDQEIDCLRSGLHLRKPQPHSLAVGQEVRIIAGPLAGMLGQIVRLKGSLRVAITVPLITQSVSVEVAAAEVEPAFGPVRC